MRIQNIRLFIYSSLAILALTLVWGFRQIPAQGDLAEDQVRVSLEQELGVIRGAVRTAVDALKLRTLDVLKAEPERAARALQSSTLTAAALAEWTDQQWKVSGFVGERPEFQAEAMRDWLPNWSLEKLAPEDAYFTKVGDVDGRAYYAMATRVRRGEQSAFAIGVFAAADFPLTLPAERVRDVTVFDSRGVALALNHSAYVGANVRQQPLVTEILEGDVLNVRTEWTNERREPMIGVATRVADANLYAAVEARAPLAAAAARQAWIYLVLAAGGAVALNWALFAGLVRPLFAQLAGAEAQVEQLRRLLSDAPAPSAPAPEAPLAANELPRVDFIESAATTEPAEPPPAPETPLSRVVGLALRGIEPRLKELDVTVDRVGLDDVTLSDDVLPLQTALEEVIKNAVEAMAGHAPRRLSIAANLANGVVRLTIEDSGPGVARENLTRIFEPFFTTREQPSGVARGLGLNVVRRIIEAMGGSVTARNLVGRTGFACELAWPRAGRPQAVAPDAPAPDPLAQANLSDLDLLADEDDDFAQVPTVAPRATPPLEHIRRPRVRTLE